MSGKYFDDWTESEKFSTPTITITETDVVIFAAMSGGCNAVVRSGCKSNIMK